MSRIEITAVWVLLLACLVFLVAGIPMVIRWSDDCAAQGGTAMSETIGEINGVPIVDAWCEGPNGERLDW